MVMENIFTGAKINTMAISLKESFTGKACTFGLNRKSYRKRFIMMDNLKIT